MQWMFFFILLVFSAIPTTATAGDDSEQIQQVRVVNLPQTQEIDGSVQIKGLIRHSFLDRREKIIIPPAQRSDTNSLTEGGIVEADGFTSVVLNILGEVKSTSFLPGTVGAILVPDEKPVIQAFTQDQAILFPLEVKTDIAPDSFRYFSSEPTKATVSFPRYRIYFYNSSNKTVEANLYLYLVN